MSDRQWPDGGSNNESRAEEVDIIDQPLLLWALGEFVLCPFAPLHSFFPPEEPSQHFETETLKGGHKFTTQTSTLALYLCLSSPTKFDLWEQAEQDLSQILT